MILGFATQNSMIYDYFKEVNPFPMEIEILKDFLLNLISTIIHSDEMRKEVDNKANKK